MLKIKQKHLVKALLNVQRNATTKDQEIQIKKVQQ